ncbi:MAG: FGGY family carbohydrate kinase [Chloroflexota bacterium]
MARDVALGADSSTQSVKVVALDVQTGEIVSEGRARHSGADIQDPRDWWAALAAASRACMTPDLRPLAISIGGQQHGCVTLDAAGEPVRPAPLWNNVDAAADAERLNAEADFAAAVGTRLVSSVTIAKLAHLARTDPGDLRRTAAVCLPHDYLTYRLTGNLVSDRGDASGSGWWSPAEDRDRRDLLALAVGEANAGRLQLPRVLGPNEEAGSLLPGPAAELGLPAGIPVGPGSGDNMEAALGIGANAGEMVISLGTSGTAFAITTFATHDETGEVCGFADATGCFLPLACMLNCTRVVDAIAGLLGVERIDALDRAHRLPPGASGLLMTPYFEGERTPNLPRAAGELFGLAGATASPDLLLRAAVDGVAAGLAYCVEALNRLGIEAGEVTLVGGGSQHPAWRQAIADATGMTVLVREAGEAAARGAALQAAAIALGAPIAEVIGRWRPPVVARVEPRRELRAAFRLGERRALIDAARERYA